MFLKDKCTTTEASRKAEKSREKQRKVEKRCWVIYRSQGELLQVLVVLCVAQRLGALGALGGETTSVMPNLNLLNNSLASKLQPFCVNLQPFSVNLQAIKNPQHSPVNDGG
jgi:hypothetical protein